MNSTALPAGTRLKGGALLIEEYLAREEKAFCYRAYDVPMRRQVWVREFFPDGAIREGLEASAPTGWSTQGWQLASEAFSTSRSDSCFSFRENNTVYVAFEQSPLSSPTSGHNTVVLPTPLITSQVQAPVSREAISPTLDSSQAPNSNLHPTSARGRPAFSLHDVLPDAIQGAQQGAIAGGLGGVLLGVLAALAGSSDVGAGALRGLLALPIGALAGALLGALRALPSNAPRLATASSRNAHDQIRSTLSGAGKGAIMGLLLGCVYSFLFVSAAAGVSLFPMLLKIVLLCLVCGAFAGAIVGFIRVDPRDRSRH